MSATVAASSVNGVLIRPLPSCQSPVTTAITTTTIGNRPSLSKEVSTVPRTPSVSSSTCPATADAQSLAIGESTGLGNNKEKTPMCLINELARFNKISHQYKLVDETGPAHKKTFSVVLKLGEEEFAASGPSIKKSQHAAADKALVETKYKHPISRVNRNRESFVINSLTPTVELNALAMKRGDVPLYTTLEHLNQPLLGFSSHQQTPPLHYQTLLPVPGLPPPGNLSSHFAIPSSDFAPRYPLPPPPPPPPLRGFPLSHPHPVNGVFPLARPPFPHPAIPPPYIPPSYDFRGAYNQRYHAARAAKLFCVNLKVGSREFLGYGATRQLARHQAATKALACIRNLESSHEVEGRQRSRSSTDCDEPVPGSLDVENVTAAPIDDDDDDDDDEEGSSFGDEPVTGEAKDPSSPPEEDDQLKSEISLVHEIALKRRLTVDFHVIKESGPPHMRMYVTQCVVEGGAPLGDEERLSLKTEAEGNGKKVSKKKAAEEMIKLLRELPPMPPDEDEELALHKVKTAPKKKRQNLIKVQKGNQDYGQGINPISRLIQIQQAKREKEPVFTLLTERGLPRRREFVMQVTVNENSCTGNGPNKKLAKRSAAEIMLQIMGYSRPSPQPDKPAIRTPGSTPTAETANKKVTFTLSDAAAERGLVDGAGQIYRKNRKCGNSLQQLPGVIFMPEGSSATFCNSSSNIEATTLKAKDNQAPMSQQMTATIAQELLNQGTSPTAEAILSNASKSESTDSSVSLMVVNETNFCLTNGSSASIIHSQLVPPQVANTVTLNGGGHFTNGGPFHQNAYLPTNLSSVDKLDPSNSIISGKVTSGSVAILPRSPVESSQAVPPKQQLIYLAKVLGFNVNFTDFPKKGHGQEYLSLVSLTTNPPQVSHGSGMTLEASQDAASLHALKGLAEWGLESVNKGAPNRSTKEHVSFLNENTDSKGVISNFEHSSMPGHDEVSELLRSNKQDPSITHQLHHMHNS